MQRIIHLICLFLLSLSAFSQPLGQVSGFSTSKKPLIYKQPTGEVAPVGAPTLQGVSTYWYVFSDRDENPTYEIPGGKKIYKKIKMGEAFWVIAEKDDYVRIVKVADGTYDVGSGKVTLMAEANQHDYGWIGKQNLLLWSESLFQNGFKQKLLAVHTVESLKDPARYAAESKIFVYNSPDLKVKNNNTIELMQFLYVYKSTGNAHLVGVLSSLNRDQGGYLLGWVSSSTLQSWGDRIVLEPNISGGNSLPPYVFKDQESAKAYAQSGTPNLQSSIWSYKKTTVPDPYWKRLPILKREGNLVTTGVVTGVYGESGKEIISADDYDNIRNDYEPKRSSTFNLVFVVEGRKGVGEQGIEAAMRVHEDAISSLSGSSKTLRSGVVVYYDKDAPCWATDGINNPEATKASLRSNLVQPVKGGSDADMLAGLERALSMFGSRKDLATNVIVLIGAATLGEDLPERTSRIAKLVADNRVHLLAFQIAGGDDYAYDNFSTQVKDVITLSAKMIAKEAEDAFASTGKIKKMQPSLSQTKVYFKYQLDYPDNSPVAGYLYFAENSSVVRTAAQLQDGAFTMLKELKEKSSKALESLDAKVVGIGPRDVEGQAVNALLGDMIRSFKTEKERQAFMNLVMSKNFQFFVEGYTPIKPVTSAGNYYDLCLFLTASELSEITVFIKKEIMDKSLDASAQVLRESIVTAYKKIIQDHYGRDRITEMMDKSPSEIMALLTGLPSTSQLLQDYTLRDIEDPSTVSDDQIAKIKEYFIIKYEKLRQLAESGSVDQVVREFKVVDKYHYWVPQSIIP